MKRKKRRFKLVVTLFILLVFTICGSIYTRNNVIPIVVNMAEAKINNYLVNAINAAAHMVIDESMTYEDMVSIVRDSKGDIVLIQSNTVKINRLARDLASLAQSNVEQIKEEIVQVPLGAITGSIVLSGYGPPFNVKLLPIGSVVCEFVSIFDAVGINQTKHSLYINVGTTINIILPIFTTPVKTSTAVLVCEHIIIGDVPLVYIQGNDAKELINTLDLSPNKN